MGPELMVDSRDCALAVAFASDGAALSEVPAW